MVRLSMSFTFDKVLLFSAPLSSIHKYEIYSVKKLQYQLLTICSMNPVHTGVLRLMYLYGDIKEQGTQKNVNPHYPH